MYVHVIISAAQLKKLKDRIKLFSQGTYDSKRLNSKQGHVILSLNHPTCCLPVHLNLEEFQSYNRSPNFDSVEIKTQENYFFKAPKLVLIMSRSGDSCIIHWGRKENASRDFPPYWSHSERQKGSQPT